MKPQLEGKFAQEGIFVGFIERTEEYIIMTPDGCVKTKDIHRLRPDEMADPVLVAQVKGKPWQMTPTMPRDAAPEDLPVSIVLEPAVPEAQLLVRGSKVDRESHTDSVSEKK